MKYECYTWAGVTTTCTTVVYCLDNTIGLYSHLNVWFPGTRLPPSWIYILVSSHVTLGISWKLPCIYMIHL